MTAPDRRSQATGEAPTRASIVLPWDRSDEKRTAEARLDEAVGLTSSIELLVVHQVVLPLKRRRPSTLLGEGQIAAMKEAIDSLEINLVVVDATVTPVQQRNLERAWNAKVIDRNGLILDIFGERAATREGVLQVELAHLAYQRSRLVRSWTHLERQRGGFGFLGGPGETQIEADRRLIDERMVKLKRELDDVRRTRGLHRSARRRVPVPIVALVGYTNAGKSTLFNALTGAGVKAQDQLFATLDPTMREIRLPSGRKAVLSDTVGFVSELPTELVAAFRATLEEVGAADVILHVRDGAHPDSLAQRQDVTAVIDGMVEDAMIDEEWRGRTIEVLNKIDLGPPIEHADSGNLVMISARTGQGLPDLLQSIDRHLSADLEDSRYELKAADGAHIAWLYEHGEVLARTDRDEIIDLEVRLSTANRARFEKLLAE